MGYTKLKPDTFMKTPYASPKNQNPVRIGIVYGKAARRAV